MQAVIARGIILLRASGNGGPSSREDGRNPSALRFDLAEFRPRGSSALHDVCKNKWGGSQTRPTRSREIRLVLQRLRGRHDGLDRDAEFLEHERRGRAQTEAVDADDLAVETDVLVPQAGDARLDRDALAA